jgi:hypothetical protein
VQLSSLGKDPDLVSVTTGTGSSKTEPYLLTLLLPPPCGHLGRGGPAAVPDETPS